MRLFFYFWLQCRSDLFWFHIRLFHIHCSVGNLPNMKGNQYWREPFFLLSLRKNICLTKVTITTKKVPSRKPTDPLPRHLSRWFSELPVWWDMDSFPGGYPPTHDASEIIISWFLWRAPNQNLHKLHCWWAREAPNPSLFLFASKSSRRHLYIFNPPLKTKIPCWKLMVGTDWISFWVVFRPLFQANMFNFLRGCNFYFAVYPLKFQAVHIPRLFPFIKRFL